MVSSAGIGKNNWGILAGIQSSVWDIVSFEMLVNHLNEYFKKVELGYMGQ